jgi:hypothetical protein
MSFFFPSSPSTSDATVSSLASSPRLGGGVDELATPTHVSESTSPRSPITATSTTRAPDSRVSGSPQAVGVKVVQNSNDSNNDHNGNGNGHYYGDNEHPLSRAASDAYEPAAHSRRDRDRDDDPRGFSELGVNLERGVDRLLRLMVAGEFSESESSLSSLDDESVMSGTRKGEGTERIRERLVAGTSSLRIHRTIGGAGDEGTHSTSAAPHAPRASASSALHMLGQRERTTVGNTSSRIHPATTGGDVGTNSTGAAARASGSSALQGTRPLTRVASPPILPPDDEETQARARTHRRRSSGDPSHPRSRRSSRRLVVHKRQEIGICKSLALVFSLCRFLRNTVLICDCIFFRIRL